MSTTMLLTGTDRALALQLRRTPRAPLAELAARLNVSERTVSRRLTRLRQDGLLHFTASLTRQARDRIHAQVEITCQPAHALAVATQLADRDDTHYVHLTAGTADVWVEFYAEDQTQLLSKLDAELPRVQGVASTRTRIVLQMLMTANDWDPQHPQTSPVQQRLDDPHASQPGPTFDDLDRALCDLLATDCRTPASQLSAALQVGEATVHRRLARLLDSGAVIPRAEIPAAALGYPVEALFALSIEPQHVVENLTRMAAAPSLRALYIVAGPHNVVGYSVHPTVGEVQQLISETFADLPGVQGSDMSLVLASPKRMGIRPRQR